MGDSAHDSSFRDFEPLPALSEDEENVSLADVLSLQDSCLTEEDIWAICLECSKSLKSIAHSAIFQTLCITPDTLAFNTNGNICFMKQISDDPEGAFMPPEIDVTGNTFADLLRCMCIKHSALHLDDYSMAHMFSLGATLEAVVEYMMEPEIDSECSQDLHTLLEKMQEENPEDRPNIEDIISLCEEKLKLSSSSDICQCLSAIGRTVLSIESCIFQDSCDNLWKRQDNQNISPYEQRTDENLRENSSPDAEDLKAESARNSSGISTMNYQSEDIKEIKNNLVDEVFCYPHISTQITKCEEEKKSTEYKLKAKPHICELGTDVLTKNCLKKVKTFPILPFESEADPRTFFPIKTKNGILTREYSKLQLRSLSSTSNNEDTTLERKLNGGDRNNQLGSKAAYFQGTNSYLDDLYLSPKLSCLYQHHVAFCDDSKADFHPYSHTVSETSDNCGILNEPDEPHLGNKTLENYELWEYYGENYPCSNENCVLGVNMMTTMFTELNKNGHSSSLLNSPRQKVTETRDYYIEDMQCEGRKPEMKANEQCVFLKHLLTWYGKPLKDYELWALCHECLLTLQTYMDYPAYLCLDSVMINSDGSVIFVPPKSEGSYDMFYLAPEISEEDFVTEKVCIYCIAAILWRAAKCNFPPDRKLVLPRKLKNFLLHMARRKSEDRPSLADAIKTCDSYLLEQSINSKKILAFLTKYAFQAFKEVDSFNDSLPFDFQSERNSVDDNLGFLPMSNESKLIAVEGPVPCQLPLNRGSTSLPNAFTSSATHFKPIILHQNTDSKKNTTASVMVQHETTMEGVVPVNRKNSMHLQIDTEKQEIEDCDLPAICMTPDILPYDTKEYSYTSSSMDKLPLLSKSSCVSQEICISQSPSSSISNCTVPSNMTFINNFLLKQDPETRVLTLVPVQIAVSEQIPNKPLHSKTAYSCSSLHVLLSDSIVSYGADKALHHKSPVNNLRNCKPANVQNAQINSFPPTTINKETQTKCSEMDASHILSNESSTAAEISVPLSDYTSHSYVDQNSASPVTLGTSYENHGINEAILKNMVHLMKEEFAFSGSCKNTDEVLAIGKYIFGLKDLQYNTFCIAISEKFSDFYWEEKLLANLYDAANGRSHLSVKMDGTKNCGKTFQGQNKPKGFVNTSEKTNVSVADVDTDDFPQDNTEKEVRTEMEGECLQTNATYITPGLPEDNQNQEEFIVRREENSYTGSSCLSELGGFCPGWRSAFYGSECFSLEVHDYVRKLGKRKASGTQNISVKIMELEQQIMIESKNYSKSRRFYYRLLHKERRTKGGEVKTMLPKLRGQLEEMRSKVQFLELVKKYLQIINTEKWGVESCSLLTVINMARSETLGISSLDSMLLFYNINKNQYNKSQCNNSQYQPRNLQAGTPLGLMAYLYCRNSFLEGYIQQLLFTFRYFCSQEELLQFILDRISTTLPSASPESCPLLSKIYFRSFSILQTWIEDCYAVDFAVNPDFMSTLKDFIISKVVPLSGYGKWLLSWLDLITRRKESNISQCLRKEDWKEVEKPSETQFLRSSCRKLSKSILQKSFNWRSSKENEAIVPYQKGKQHNSTSVLPKECFRNVTEGFCARIDGGQYFLTEYTAQQLCCQLTLLQQEMFHKCHPVHFLNSRFLGVKDKSVPLQKTTSSELLPTQIYNLFVENCVQDDYLLQLLKYADNVSTWVAAEIVTSYSSKVQVNLLTKFLFIAKCCYEQRNFATTMQILNALENLVVRQLPVWKCLPSKVLEIMEELKAVEVFLKSDNLCLMEGERFKTSPTIPSAHLLAMHIQQLETGGFTMRNGMYKWTKLRNIAKVVSQVHAFQENSYAFPPDHQLQSFLRHRIASFNDADISALAAVNSANFHQIPVEKKSRKIQDTLHRMKTMFQ